MAYILLEFIFWLFLGLKFFLIIIKFILIMRIIFGMLVKKITIMKWKAFLSFRTVTTQLFFMIVRISLILLLLLLLLVLNYY